MVETLSTLLPISGLTPAIARAHDYQPVSSFGILYMQTHEYSRACARLSIAFAASKNWPSISVSPKRARCSSSSSS